MIVFKWLKAEKGDGTIFLATIASVELFANVIVILIVRHRTNKNKYMNDKLKGNCNIKD